MSTREGWTETRGLPAWAAVLLLASMIALASLAFTQPSTHQAEPPGWDGASKINPITRVASLGTDSADARWYKNCVTHRNKHAHYLREVIHVWKNVTQWHSQGRFYVRGTWASIRMNSGNQFASDRRTYDCTGRR